jgi:L-seryl-tRNA(Ser) seleniumtransferase
MEMLARDGILTIGAVAMPSSAPVVRLMMYPDGHRLGVDRIAASLSHGIAKLSEVLDDIDAARERLLGSPLAVSPGDAVTAKARDAVGVH